MTAQTAEQQNDQPAGPPPVRVALCVDPDALDRLGRVLRHLCVGMVDQAVQLRLVSSDPSVASLTLGPVQTVIHRPVVWPVAQRRFAELSAALAAQPPTVVHAFSRASYKLAEMLALRFDADLVVQVTSLADGEHLRRFDTNRIRAFIAPSEPLSVFLTDQLQIEADRIELIRPGIRAAPAISSFADEHEAVTLLCTSPFRPDSGVDRLIEAAAMVHRAGHEFLLFLLGQGNQESALRRLVRARKLHSQVTFARPMGDPASAMQGADVFVRPSADTALVDDTLQAMANGVAVVAAYSPVCDHLRPEETAVVCESATPAALAGAIERFLVDRMFAQSIAGGALEYVRTQHSVSRMAEAAAAVYRKLTLARATFSLR